ncbi:BMP family ABC transporter substrate-binding protein [Paenibacillus sp. BGI2013]|uniref:BMP family lipoprotein n=1 Tax=Paenibacillus TaxID=44249 RepID=UPI00096EFC21|nr:MULTISPECIES: BMP family ABC transporter substrate-binding protein [Paenibacillus]UOK65183.1 BMP family ABC transporter substrate-binding protein [Paenibacillus sp. OVF10]MCL6659877.1 BMP family ABC transporter substrate-binding protein [Paenibacillus amylolyticus]OME99462.1 BMP family ABC transporter substrate-binding protein [Paenibacillus amylolyticus]OMF43182.1 BMP family ABC transporter substrate-binding protein [Paenibacillus amylolyticus]PJN49829.1 Membrane lipoprotein TmpC precursor
MKKMLSLSLVMLLAVSVMLAGCGSKPKEETNAGGDTGGTSTEAKSDLKIGMVTDVGGVNDKSFNQSAWEALQATETETGTAVKYLQSKSDEEYIPNLNEFVKGGYDLTWGIGFQLADAIKTVAEQNPDAKLAIIDSVVDAPNVKSVTFAEEEGSYLVGVVAGLTTKSNKIGFVGGMESPLIKKFEVGFREGVKAVNPDAQFISNYTGAFDKPDLGKAAAATLYNEGVDIIFHASGATGNGVFNEASARKKQGQDVWVIGVDKDQSLEFGDEITLTSMIKKVDEAVKRVNKEVVDGTFAGGSENLTLKENGVGIADTSTANVSADTLAKVEEYKEKIISGEIKVPTE